MSEAPIVSKSPFQKVVDDLTGGCGCACHTGTGYRTSCEHCSPPDYRLWVNEARTVLVTWWKSGTVTVATRETPAHTWGPPVHCEEER